MEMEVCVCRENTLVLMSPLCYAVAYIFNQRFSQGRVQKESRWAPKEDLNGYSEKNVMPQTQEVFEFLLCE